ncbi:MORN repeat protein [Gregarina niphandrodes]|uniref:MORN repeat protein n=1 Tax=Gregarina niphandrodes TaxID=110365 RepID=A0A023AYT3_GRENI|nr:MORN repeat protein [Gregarina niphandrodes]EZG43613.1 MORN repeat protein [Gregarina niphandrodes]|eukprot:XP_011133141.1 MORN repeat protein [Gregarina niphandrodes]
MVGVFKVLPVVASGYWIRPNYAKMDPNATYHGQEGVFIPHIEGKPRYDAAAMVPQMTTTQLATATPTTTTKLATLVSSVAATTTHFETVPTTTTALATTQQKTTKTRAATTTTQLYTELQTDRTKPAKHTTGATTTTTGLATQTDKGAKTEKSAKVDKKAQKVEKNTTTGLQTSASTGAAKGLFGRTKTNGQTTTDLATVAARSTATPTTTGLATTGQASKGQAGKGLVGMRDVASDTTTGLATTKTATTTKTAATTTTTRLVTAKHEQPKKGLLSRLTGGGGSSHTGLFFSNIPRQAENLPSLHKKGGNDITVYRDEPLMIGVWSEDKDKYLELDGPTVDVLKANTGVARESFVELIPRGAVGDVKHYNVSLSNYDRTEQHAFPLTLHLAESRSAKLGSLTVKPGRLDPSFNPNLFDYKIRVPEKAHSVHLDFKTWNDRDAKCTLDGSKWFTAKGSVSVSVPSDAPNAAPLTLSCLSADGSVSQDYNLSMVPQRGGETLLSDLEVYGADLAEPFDPNNHGPYRADLVKGAAKDQGIELGWARLKLGKVNPNAVVTVNGKPVEGDMSGWIRIPRGDKKSVDVSVSTPENPVAEQYQVVLSRQGNRSYLSTEEGLKASNWLGWLSSLSSTRNAAYVLNNNKVLDLLSTYGHSTANNEVYADFATGFHLWNAQPGHCGSTWLKLRDANGQLIDCDDIDFDSAIGDALVEQDAKVPDAKAELDGDGRWSLNLNAPKRKLISISASDREQLKQNLDTQFRARENLFYYSSTLTVVAAIVAVALSTYGVIYAAMLRDPETGTMRADYPAVLHPGRFLSFVLDFAFVGFVSGAFGLLFCSKATVSGVSVFGVHLSKALLNALSVVVLMLAVGYIALGSAALANVADKVGYSAQFCEYHDLVMSHGRAIHTPRWCQNIPILRRLCAVNVDSVVPLKSASVPGSTAVSFTEVQAPEANAADGTEYSYQKLYVAGDKYAAEDGPEYSHERKAVQVAVNDFLYNDQATNYDGRNHTLYGRYPEAKFGETQFKLQNPYGYPVYFNADLQIQHLTALMQLVDDFRFWAPRKNCCFPASDNIRNLLSSASRGLYMDWAINRGLLFVALGLFAFFNRSASLLPLYVLTFFSFASAMIRLPTTFYSANAKFELESRVRAQEQQEVDAAIAATRTAEKIWPFTEPGFMDRFRGIVRRKEDARWFGLYSLFNRNPLETEEEAGALQQLYHSQGAYQLREVLFTPCGADIGLFLLGLVLILGRSTSGRAQLVPGVFAIFLCAVMLFCINFRSLQSLWQIGQDSLDECLQKATEAAIHVNDALTGPGGLGACLPYYAQQCVKTLKGDPTANFHYPRGPVAVRNFPVSDVAVVSNELGLQFPGRIGRSDLQHLATVPDEKRLRLYKTLVVHGGLAGARAELYRSLPVQVPFCKLFHEDGAPALNPNADFGPLVATIQVVNHTLRANNAGLSATDKNEHDSFLSLYAQEEFLPTPGKVLLRKEGHTYSVRFDANQQRLTVRGPSIVANKTYTLRTSKTGSHARKDMYINGRNPDDSVSSGSATLHPAPAKAAAGVATCEAPGALRLAVPPEHTPWMHKTFLVRPTREPNATAFEIDPEEIKVYYDKDCGELYLRHEDLTADQEYEVEWFVYPDAPEPVDASARADENGAVQFDVEPEMPDLRSWMVLRDESGAVVDIDPAMTDAYQFFFPEAKPSVWQTLTGHMAALASMIRGGDKEAEAMEEPIPCTVVQCVNPLQKVYRVDPNFGEGLKILNARIHEFRARQRACEVNENIASLWPTLMKATDYLDFWKARGVDATDAFGNLIDPLAEPAHVEAFHSHLQRIAEGENDLRRTLSQLLDEKVEQLTTQIEAVRVWMRAYEDPLLHTAQLQADLNDWSMHPDDDGSASSAQLVLQSQKALYSARLSGFFYPCNVPDALLSKRPNLAAQFRVWSNILQSWLFAEEGVDVGHAETRLRVSAVVRDVMQALKFTLHANEKGARNQYRSVLHYVVGSHTLRGTDATWKPDGLKAHTALVRIWTEDEQTGTADFSKYPEWLPCLLRLTPGALQVLLPNGDDLVRPVSGNLAFPWQKSTGLYVPLHAFHKFELVEKAEEPYAGESGEGSREEDGNVLLRFMTTKLVCRKNQRDGVPDAYARRVEDDQLGNEICFTDASGQRRMRYRLMLGHCVSREQALAYPQGEVDPTLSSSEVNVYPLSFRMAPAFAEQWRRAIVMAQLDTPHDHLFDATVDEPETNREPEEDQASTIIDPPSEESDPVVIPEIVPEPVVVEDPEPVEIPEPVIVPPPPESISESSLSEQSRSVESNPEGISLYEGPITNNKLHGECVIRDEGGRAVYEGPLSQGLREGRGKVGFTDAYGTQWTYEGELRGDETGGKCVVSLADSTAVANVTDRYTLVSYTGTVSAPPKKRRSMLLPEEVECLLHNKPLMREEVYDKGSLPSKKKVLELVKSVYARPESYGYRLTADRFAVADVLQDKYLLDAARDGDCPPSRFLQTFLPYACAWQDETTLLRASPEGEWRFVDGSVFKGALEGGKPTGKGVYNHWPTNTLFEGNMRNGLPDGEGTLVTGDSKKRAVYRGSLIQGAREGQGTLTTHDKKATVKAVWNQDKLGTGPVSVELDPSLMSQLDVPFTKFEGYVRDGVPEGEATMSYENKRTFKGQVNNAIREGKGEIRDESGNLVIEGNFHDNSPEGLVRFAKYPDGLVYKGEMSKGARQGMGHLFDPKTDQVVYEGTWANDVPHGRGVYRAADGEYEGEFKNGKRHGKGRFTFKEKPLANGKQRMYEGDWSNDLPHGVGKYTNDDALECVYRLEKGEIVSSSVNSYAPTCGKAPAVSSKPTVQPTSFKPYSDRDLPWKKAKHASIGNVLQVLTDNAPTWNDTAGKSATFIDPTRVVPLQRISSD